MATLSVPPSMPRLVPSRLDCPHPPCARLVRSPIWACARLSRSFSTYSQPPKRRHHTSATCARFLRSQTVRRRRWSPQMALSWMAHRCTYPPAAWPQSPTSTLRARLFRPCRTRLHLRNHASAACGRFPHSTIAHRLVLRFSAGALAEQLLEDAIDFAPSRAFTMSPMPACALHGHAAQTVNASELSAAFNEKEGGGRGAARRPRRSASEPAGVSADSNSRRAPGSARQFPAWTSPPSRAPADELR